MREGSLFGNLKTALSDNWRTRARPEQIAPEGDWDWWHIESGRGWGKTWTGANNVQDMVQRGLARHVGLIAPTAADCRDVMIEGPSGILSIAPAHFRPEYEPSKRRLTWPNGAVATAFSAEEPERLRGPQYDLVWCDELAAWVGVEAWDNMNFGLRIGRARGISTTTPRPTKLIRNLHAREGNGVVITRGRTLDNAANLSSSAVKFLIDKYGGTRLGRQELDGELLEDVPGALWRRTWIDEDRVERAPEDISRIVVAIDPAVSNTENSDETGIVVAGRSRDGQHYYVLDDMTARLGPLDWAKKAVSAFRRHEADRIVAETNNGGALVEATLRQVDQHVPYKEVKASRGKAVRAEPISALYEQHRVHHVGEFAQLEEQMCAFTSDFDRNRAGYSPDRVDALVWAITELSGGKMPMIISDEILQRSADPRMFAQPFYFAG